jgi:hypothetical protein
MDSGLIRRFVNFLRARRKQGTTFVSYRPSLVKLCQNFPLERIVEFGPGISTHIFLEHSRARIWSYETNLDWFRRYERVFDPLRVAVIYCGPDWTIEQIGEQAQQVSLAFIDGGDRLQALAYFAAALPQTGIAFLHDAHREDYESGLRAYPYRYFTERHSCLLFKDPELYHLVKTAIPPDYSCRCRYCSSPDRRAYFTRLAGAPED